MVAVAVTLGIGVGGYLLFDRSPVRVGNLFGVSMSFLFAVVAGDAARSRGVAAAEQARRRAEERTELARELHDALGELDSLLRVVKAAPPSLHQLADREVRLAEEEVALAAEPAHALHRIAQEAVTNALRHTESDRIDVDLRRVGDMVVLEVINQGGAVTTGPPGHSLANMRERAHRAGGELETGPFEGGFRVRATTLPTLP